MNKMKSIARILITVFGAAAVICIIIAASIFIKDKQSNEEVNEVSITETPDFDFVGPEEYAGDKMVSVTELKTGDDVSDYVIIYDDIKYGTKSQIKIPGLMSGLSSTNSDDIIRLFMPESDKQFMISMWSSVMDFPEMLDFKTMSDVDLMTLTQTQVENRYLEKGETDKGSYVILECKGEEGDDVYYQTLIIRNDINEMAYFMTIMVESKSYKREELQSILSKVTTYKYPNVGKEMEEADSE